MSHKKSVGNAELITTISVIVSLKKNTIEYLETCFSLVTMFCDTSSSFIKLLKLTNKS